MDYILQCDYITKKVGAFMLRDIHFELEPGYILGVVGRNGAGKSTLVHILLGSLKLYNYHEDYRYKTPEGKGLAANRGDVFLNGYSVKWESDRYKEQVAFVLKDSPFSMKLSAKDNGRWYGSYYKGFDYKKYRMLCEKYDVPFELPLKDLSKGEQIKQQLAFSLSYDAKLYILDEPTGNLDVRFRNELYDIMHRIVEDGTKSIIYVSHLVEEMEKLADYILWIDNGMQKTYDNMEHMMDTYLLYDGEKNDLDKQGRYQVVAKAERESHFEALLYNADGDFPENVLKSGRRATLKEIMYYKQIEEKDNENNKADYI